MARSLSRDELRALRLRAQLLAGERPGQVAAAVARVGALQAQSMPAARLAVRARTTGLTGDDVDRACDAERGVVRTWLMRGTLHMVAAGDVGWMVALLGPLAARAYRRRRAELGLDEPTCERALGALATILPGAGALSRADLIERLADEGVWLDRATQAAAHLLMYAAFHGLVCRGPEAGRDATYVLVDEWVGHGPAIDRDEALARLARRYLAGHGPATAGDFAVWSGLPRADARSGFALIRDELVELQTPDAPVMMLEAADPVPPAEPPPRLLGAFDEYLLGYRGRGLVLDPRFAKRVQHGGIIQSVVLAAGRVVGTWRLEPGGGLRRVVVQPFGVLPRSSREGLRREANDVGRFLGVAAELAI